MRNALLALLALVSASAAMVAGSAPAAAYDYPWCVQGQGYGVPGDCSYQTFGQCMASASGRRVSCNINPRVAFDRRDRAYRNPAHQTY